MPFTAGALCCSSDACVLLDTAVASDEVAWDLIPHVTQVGVTKTSNTPKLVTSSTGGEETSACGTVTQNGVLDIACHDGASPFVLCINGQYRIRWAQRCEVIWTGGQQEDGGVIVAVPDVSAYFDATIRITTVPIVMNISGNVAQIYTYTFDIVQWHTYPTCEPVEL